MKRPQPAPITGASGAICSRAAARRRRLDLRDLTFGEMARDVGHGKQTGVVRSRPSMRASRAALSCVLLPMRSGVG